MDYPQLIAGMRGQDVKALQLALRHALGKHSRNQANGVYGVGTIRDVFAFKKAHKILPVNGKTAGTRMWQELMKKNSTVAVRAALAAAPSRVSTPMDDVIAEAYYGLSEAGRLVYTQHRPMPPDLESHLANFGVDCSTFVTLCYKAGGLPDPNGQNYNGYGYTGTLWSGGMAVPSVNIEPGDLIFYGSMGGMLLAIPGHVAISVGGGFAISFGSEPGPKKVAILYRKDFRGARRYWQLVAH
jgi:cell wall-associated NlpC family hydrolase